MVEEATPPADEPASDAPEAVEPQANEQAAQQQIRLRMDHREMSTSYANMVMTHSMPNEVLLDFGLNLVAPSAQQQGQPEMVFKVNDRIIMNYYSAKQLAITLSQVVRRFEEQFGELELDVAKRRKGADGPK